MSFKLSNSGRLSVIIAIALSTGTFNALANPSIVANGGTGVSTANNGAVIINIIAPNIKGLSHNTYDRYNVNKPGAVLNNSMKAGQSQLAGHINRNNNLTGGAAKIILNEVTSRNPSMLLGSQEVFGMAADYVLANPNGITCNGCGFINMNSSTLAVANVTISKGEIESFDATQNSNLLNIQGGGLTADGFLRLISPRIESRGAIFATQEIHAVSGHNIVKADGTIEFIDTTSIEPLDSYYLGGMKAGSIKIVSTDAGSGVFLGDNIVAKDELDITSAQELKLTAAQLKGGDVTLKAKNIDSIGEVKTSTSRKASDENYKNYRGAINNNDTKTTQRLLQSEIEGKNILLVAEEETHLSGTKISGTEVNISGGKVVLDGQTVTQRNDVSRNRWFYSWVHNENSVDIAQEQFATELEASGHIAINSTKSDIEIAGTQINAQAGVSIKAENDIKLNGLVAGSSHSKTVYTKNEGGALRTGTVASSEHSEKVTSANIRSDGDISFDAKGNITTQAIEVDAGGDLNISAQKEVTIGTTVAKSGTSSSDDHKYWGGIGGGSNKLNDKENTISNRSSLHASGDLDMEANSDINLIGAKVTSDHGGSIRTVKGDINIDKATNTSIENNNSRSGTVFNITKDSDNEKITDSKVQGSHVKADVSLDLISGNDAIVTSSKVETDGSLNVSASNNIIIDSASDTQNIDKVTTKLSVKGEAGAESEKQYKVGVTIAHNKETTITDKAVAQGSSLKGGDVSLNASETIIVKGGSIETTNGDANINGKNVEFLASENTTEVKTDSATTGAGISFSGGIEKGRVAINATHNGKTSEINTSKAKVSNSNIAGDLNITASEKVTQQGAKQKVGGNISIDANSLDNLAAKDTVTTKESALDVGVELGAEINYAGVTKPIEGAIKTLINTDVAGTAKVIKDAGVAIIDAGKELVGNKGETILAQGSKVSKAVGVVIEHDIPGKVTKAIDAVKEIKTELAKMSEADFAIPEARVDLGIKVDTKNSDSGNEVANVTSMEASNISINVTDKLLDQGTNYGSQGSVEITAAEHESTAAYDTSFAHSKEITSDVGLQVGTSTGEDISVTARGKGGEKVHQDSASTAKVGTISANDGVIINARENASYTGTRIDGGAGSVEIASNGDLTFEQAIDQSSESNHDFNLDLSVTGGTSPNAKGGSGSIKGGYSHDNSIENKGAGSVINSQADVLLNAANDLALQGTNIGSKDQKVGDISLNAGGDIDLSATTSLNEHNEGSYAGSISGGSDVTKGTKNSASSSKSKMGLDLKLSQSNDKTNATAGGSILSDSNIAINAGGIGDEAINIEGTKVEGQNIDLTASNGGVKISSALDEKHANNWGVELDANGSMDTKAKDPSKGAGLGVKFDVGNIDNSKFANSEIKASNININTDKDLSIKGAVITGEKVAGNIGGDLNIASQQEIESSFNVNGEVGLDYSQKKPEAKEEADLEKTDLSKTASNVIKDLAKGASLSGGFSKINNVEVKNATGISGSDGVELNVEGDQNLVSAKIVSENGKVETNAQNKESSVLKDSKQDIGFTANVAKLVKNVFSMISGR